MRANGVKLRRREADRHVLDLFPWELINRKHDRTAEQEVVQCYLTERDALLSIPVNIGRHVYK